MPENDNQKVELKNDVSPNVKSLAKQFDSIWKNNFDKYHPDNQNAKDVTVDNNLKRKIIIRELDIELNNTDLQWVKAISRCNYIEINKLVTTDKKLIATKDPKIGYVRFYLKDSCDKHIFVYRLAYTKSIALVECFINGQTATHLAAQFRYKSLVPFYLNEEERVKLGSNDHGDRRDMFNILTTEYPETLDIRDFSGKTPRQLEKMAFKEYAKETQTTSDSWSVGVKHKRIEENEGSDNEKETIQEKSGETVNVSHF
ncbi:hypothetical protein SNEBB_010400 [Seison nebaliae]|nr:hypothetical protein SNEBB_010400 [Seison nebaliae]